MTEFKRGPVKEVKAWEPSAGPIDDALAEEAIIAGIGRSFQDHEEFRQVCQVAIKHINAELARRGYR